MMSVLILFVVCCFSLFHTLGVAIDTCVQWIRGYPSRLNSLVYTSTSISSSTSVCCCMSIIYTCIVVNIRVMV